MFSQSTSILLLDQSGVHFHGVGYFTLHQLFKVLKDIFRMFSLKLSNAFLFLSPTMLFCFFKTKIII